MEPLPETAANCPAPLTHSAANVFDFFGFLRSYYPGCNPALPSGFKLAAGIQTALAYISLFFLGLGLRSRFRLR